MVFMLDSSKAPAGRASKNLANSSINSHWTTTVLPTFPPSVSRSGQIDSGWLLEHDVLDELDGVLEPKASRITCFERTLVFVTTEAKADARSHSSLICGSWG